MGESRKEKPVVPVLAIPALHSTPAKKCKRYRGVRRQTHTNKGCKMLRFPGVRLAAGVSV